VETVDFFPTEVTMPFQSSQDLLTQAATQLTIALLHPQPEGPCCQVGDEQMLTLEGLSAIFEGALPSHNMITVPPPPGKITNSDTPLRVQITCSPPRVPNAATPRRVVQPIVTHITTPNSHRILIQLHAEQ
jgi:hypothetical protein